MTEFDPPLRAAAEACIGVGKQMWVASLTLRDPNPPAHEAPSAAEIIDSGPFENRMVEAGASALQTLLNSDRDPRTAAVVLQIVQHVRHMDLLVRNVARVAVHQSMSQALPDELVNYFLELGKQAYELTNRLYELLHGQRESMRGLRKTATSMSHAFQQIPTNSLGWNQGFLLAVEVTRLLGCYEQFTDNALAITRLVQQLHNESTEDDEA